MLYQFNEGSLELPDQAINKTLHMLVLNQAEGLSFSMIVSGMLADGYLRCGGSQSAVHADE